jgi:hypothetical protein
MYRVVQSDCRTGWYVVDSADKAVSPVFRSRAQAIADMEWLFTSVRLGQEEK